MSWYKKYAQQLDFFEEVPEQIGEIDKKESFVKEIKPYNGNNKPFKVFKRNVSGGENFMGYVFAPTPGQAKWKAENIRWVDSLDLNNQYGGVTKVYLDDDLLNKMIAKAKEVKDYQNYLEEKEKSQIESGWWQN